MKKGKAPLLDIDKIQAAALRVIHMPEVGGKLEAEVSGLAVVDPMSWHRIFPVANGFVQLNDKFAHDRLSTITMATPASIRLPLRTVCQTIKVRSGFNGHGKARVLTALKEYLTIK